ncbi:hypothetical protein CCYA_CCYA14G3793 [Cyanidiococcus yangmingshanensis]|nr:hypothetical protein CCYA_CCYA14G3793 [Cyanidiococcus yangmingshanensis]
MARGSPQGPRVTERCWMTLALLTCVFLQTFSFLRTILLQGKYVTNQKSNSVASNTLSLLNLVFWSGTVFFGYPKQHSGAQDCRFHRTLVASFSLALFVLFDSCLRIAGLIEIEILRPQEKEVNSMTAASIDLIYIDVACIVVGLTCLLFASFGSRGAKQPKIPMGNFSAALVAFFAHSLGTKVTCFSWTGFSAEEALECKFAALRALVTCGTSAALAIAVMWRNSLPILMALPSARAKKLETALKRIAVVPGCLELRRSYFWENSHGRWEAAICIAVSEELDQRLVVSIARDNLQALLDDITIMAISREEMVRPSFQNSRNSEFCARDMCVLELSEEHQLQNTTIIHNHTHLE